MSRVSSLFRLQLNFYILYMSLPTTARGWDDLGQAISHLKAYIILETVLYMLFTLSILFLAGLYLYAMSIIK